MRRPQPGCGRCLPWRPCVGSGSSSSMPQTGRFAGAATKICRPPRGSIQSPHDVEARYGIKRTMNWTGYKVHLTETCEADQPNLITNVETTDATVPDTELLDPIHVHLV